MSSVSRDVNVVECHEARAAEDLSSHHTLMPLEPFPFYCFNISHHPHVKADFSAQFTYSKSSGRITMLFAQGVGTVTIGLSSCLITAREGNINVLDNSRHYKSVVA